MLEAQEIKETGNEEGKHRSGASRSGIFPNKSCTIGLDLGDRASWYCVLDESGAVLLEHRVSTSAKALREVFGGMPHSRIALETRDALALGEPLAERAGA